MCLFTLSSSLNDLSQILQGNAFLQVVFTWWLLSVFSIHVFIERHPCSKRYFTYFTRIRLLTSVYSHDFLHISQEKGLLPVCILLCFVKSNFFIKPLLQIHRNHNYKTYPQRAIFCAVSIHLSL